MNTGDLGVNAERLAQRLARMGHGCTFVDVGVRDGVSSEIMLIDAPQRGNVVFGVDASPCPASLLGRWHYVYHEGDSVTFLADSPDVFVVNAAFVDTLHIAEQVMCETYFLWPKLKIGGFIAYHDTEWPAGKKDHYLGRDWDTPDVGVVRMFSQAERDGAVEIEHFRESWGMTFIWKRADFDFKAALDWKPVFAGRNALLAVLPESVRKREITP